MLVKCVDVCDVPSWIYGCFENTAPEGGFPEQALQAALPGLGVGRVLQDTCRQKCSPPATVPAPSPGRTSPSVGRWAVF